MRKKSERVESYQDADYLSLSPYFYFSLIGF